MVFSQRGGSRMKFAISADLHLSLYANSPINKETNLSETLSSIMKTLTNLSEYCIKENIDKIIFAGDIFHNKSIIYTVAQFLFIEYIRKYKSINFIIINGNHDCVTK